MCIPYPSVSFSKKCVGLNALGDLLGTIERIILSIPGVGHVWRMVNDLVGNFLSGIFKKIGFEVPSFKISLGPLNDAVKKIRDSITSLFSFADFF